MATKGRADDVRRTRFRRLHLQIVFLLGSTAVVGVLFAAPALTKNLSLIVFAPAVIVAAFVSGNVHNISGPVYFVALALELYGLLNLVYWASTRLAAVFSRS